MYFATPIDYDKVMKKIPYGKVITVGKIREYFAKLSGEDFTEPIKAGIFVSIAAWASDQRSEGETSYWRTLKANGELNAKYPDGIEAQKEKFGFRYDIPEIIVPNIVHLLKLLTNLSADSAAARSLIIQQRNG